jgi:hypothetical protein
MTKESVSQLRRRMALEGATARLDALEKEVAAIKGAFPELKPLAFGATLGSPALRSALLASRQRIADSVEKTLRQTPTDGRSNWSAKRKREHTARMKAFWAKRRKAKKGVKREQATKVSAKA